ncbi:hypothetical protein PCANC_18581 [Puccinia coronata f. sp. avenae]|uniref:Uncharacterized protein n=1 Tax=Puccinia coronata f. sp. avenae TaxID=200324 RepID=A0A2N5TMG0_9BASI|nr:hypothetical protein PCANC_18581 [Puccinia coronata f. sp. avenae]
MNRLLTHAHVASTRLRREGREPCRPLEVAHVRQNGGLVLISGCLEGWPAHAPVAVLNLFSTLRLGFGNLIMGTVYASSCR